MFYSYCKRPQSPEFHYDMEASAIVLITNLLVMFSDLWFQTITTANLCKIGITNEKLLVSITLMRWDFTSLQLMIETIS